MGVDGVQKSKGSHSISASSGTAGDRRRVDPAKLKRKKKLYSSPPHERTTRPRQQQLSLRDEDYVSTAKAAQQPRRL